MSKIGLWKSIFGHREEQKVSVRVGGKSEQMTNTQSYRFDELKNAGNHSPKADHNPLDHSRYTLEDAAFRLMISEDELLEKAAAGAMRLYIDANGLVGRWRRRGHDGGVIQSSVHQLMSGILRLRSKDCHQLAASRLARVTVLDLCNSSSAAVAEFNDDTLLGLTGLGEGPKQFFPQEPVDVTPDSVILLPPLAPSGRGRGKRRVRRGL